MNKPPFLRRPDIVYPKLSYALIGILYEVHNRLGHHFQEKYYQRAVAELLRQNGYNFKQEISSPIYIGNSKIGKYILDFLVEDKVVLELKAKPHLGRDDFRQVKAYLKAKGLKLGILVNFCNEQLKFYRILNPEVNPQ